MNDQKKTLAPITLFYSYAQEDERLRDELEKHLSLLQRQGLITPWHVRMISPGTATAQVIDDNFTAASIILLLISPDFLASDYCYSIEMQRALERQKSGAAYVIPVLLRSVDWHDAPFEHLQSLPGDGRAVTRWSNQDEAFEDVAQGIRFVVEHLSDSSEAGSLSTWVANKQYSCESPINRAQQHSKKQHIPHPHQNLLSLFQREYSQRYTQSLQRIPEISLRLRQRFRETHSSAQRVFRRTLSVEDVPFPDNTSIVDAYDHLSKGMLLLGEPGGGKTTLLLELAAALLARAQTEPTLPIPVILNLSSWGKKQQPFDAWVVDELELAYGIPPFLGKKYLEQEQLLLLLDELDAVAFNEPHEVTRKVRSACVQAINTYHRSRSVPLVICSRSQDYGHLKHRLALSGTVIVQPLEKQEVMRYLERQGKPLEAIYTGLRNNKILQSLITTPFMLSILIQTYKDNLKDFPRYGSIEDQQRQILKKYIQYALQRQPDKVFSSSLTAHFLTYLARQMQQHQQTVLYLEQLQAEWLPLEQTQRRFHSLSALFIIFLLGITSILAAFFASLIDKKIAGIVDIELVGVMMYYGIMQGQVSPNISRKPIGIKPIERLAWSWKRSIDGLPWGLSGILVGLSVSSYGKPFTQILATRWFISLIAGLLAGLIGVLLNGLTGSPIQERERIRPNQGIHDSGVKALVCGSLMLPGVTLFNWIIGGQGIDLLAGLILGFPISLTVGMYYGGFSFFRSYLLRFMLWREKRVPWRFVLFLDQCTNCMLLQRIGGGYSFIHPLFFEYLATFSPESILDSVQPITHTD